MESLLNQRTVIALGLVSVAALILIAAAPDRTKLSFGDIDTVVSNQETLVVCPQGAPSCHFSQIQDAIDAAPEGTTIVIKSGTYEENVIVRKSLTLQAAEGEHVVVKSATKRFPTLLLVSSRPIHVGVEGLILQPARQHQGNGIEILGMVAARLERNTLDDYEFAILVMGKEEVERGLSKLPLVITGNTIHGGIVMIRNSAFIEISKNSIRPKVDPETTVSYGGAIAIDASVDVTVSENLIEWGGGVMISQSSIITMERNIIRKSFGIYIEKISRFVTLSGNQIEQNGLGVAVTRGSSVKLTGNRITQQELYGLVVESPEDIVLCEKNHIRDNQEGDYRVQSPTISFFSQPRRDPAAEEQLRQQCEGG